MIPKLRIARPTNNLAAVRHFYMEGLGLTERYAFAGHDGFDGLMLGHPDAPYHFEFTQQAGHIVPPAPTAENLLVFYLPERAQWEAAVARMHVHGYAPVPAYNTYWDRLGLTFADPDGYRVVLQQAAWNF
jgi:catechol 2,3-dioxygenase-like lactoylglutathione lyase family enzyme